MNNNNLIKFSCQIVDYINMFRILNIMEKSNVAPAVGLANRHLISVVKARKGIALQEYVLIAVLFSLACASMAYYINPDLLRRYFERSIDSNTQTAADGTLTLPVMGE